MLCLGTYIGDYFYSLLPGKAERPFLQQKKEGARCILASTMHHFRKKPSSSPTPTNNRPYTPIPPGEHTERESSTFPRVETRGRSPLHRVRSHYQSSPYLTIRVTSRSTSLDRLKSRLGRRLMGQRRSPSKQSRNRLICVCRSRPLWELFRFSSRTMM